MTRLELLEDLREALGDTVQPYGWSDKRLLRWLADGEDRFCELTGFFTDSATYAITTQEGVTDYPLPGRIIEVKGVKDAGRALRQIVELERIEPVGATCRPLTWQTDHQTGYLSLGQLPVADVVLSLRVHRRAILRLDHRNASGINDVDAPSIPEQCHQGLIEFAAAAALGDHDSERQDPVKAADHRANFDGFVTLGQSLFDRINGASPRITPNRLYVV